MVNIATLSLPAPLKDRAQELPSSRIDDALPEQVLQAPLHLLLGPRVTAVYRCLLPTAAATTEETTHSRFLDLPVSSIVKMTFPSPPGVPDNPRPDHHPSAPKLSNVKERAESVHRFQG